jgi:hypothetical protein
MAGWLVHWRVDARAIGRCPGTCPSTVNGGLCPSGSRLDQGYL